VKRLLSRRNLQWLREVAARKVLLAFDFDGTLAPIVAEPGAARMRERTARLLEQVCRLYPCAVISGRGRRDVAGRLGQARVKYVVGNHGVEVDGSDAPYRSTMARAVTSLERGLATVQGVELEDKGSSISLHYRRARRPNQARSQILQALQVLPGPTRIVPGKFVINVLPFGAPHKGDALLALRDASRAEAALYVGDDVTDEDVFELRQPGRLVTVRVGASRGSSAEYYLRHQREIDLLLEVLVAARAAGARVGETRE